MVVGVVVLSEIRFVVALVGKYVTWYSTVPQYVLMAVNTFCCVKSITFYPDEAKELRSRVILQTGVLY
jgi:hypothetical protein